MPTAPVVMAPVHRIPFLCCAVVSVPFALFRFPCVPRTSLHTPTSGPSGASDSSVRTHSSASALSFGLFFGGKQTQIKAEPLPILDPPTPKLAFRPLEYWKPPKAVRHIRAKSSAVFSQGPAGPGRHTFVNPVEEGVNKDLSLVSMDGNFGRKNEFRADVQMADGYRSSRGPPPAYTVDREDTLARPWWDFKSWGWKRFAALGATVVIVIVIIVIVAVEVTKKNKYPDYSKLNYSLVDTYSGTGFFDNFDYFNTYDPSDGFVHYVPAETADSTQYNLTYASSSSAVLKVDTTVTAETVPNASTGRFSVRISSKTQYSTGLFIFDILHTPIGCATWPALWLADPSNWPDNGEIDVMEAVNVVSNAQNQMTLHTSKGCSMSVKRKETGKSLKTNCLNSTDSNAGCGVTAGQNTFGVEYNTNGGGVMALELRSEGIRMWQFTRSSIPSDITSGSPDPSTWSEATADFPSTDCDIGTHFKNQSIIANIDLCGSWAGQTSVYSENCPGTCTDYVANNNTAFADSYWEFGKFQIYQAS